MLYRMVSIYVLRSTDGSFPECYVGKTKKALNVRFSKHKYGWTHREKLAHHSDDSRSESFHLFEKGDVMIAALEENVPAELANTRERFHIQNTPNCVNVRLSWATKQEENKYQNDKRKEYTKAWNLANAERIKKEKKEKYEANKELRNQLTICEACRCPVMLRGINRHNATKKHLANLSPQNA